MPGSYTPPPVAGGGGGGSFAVGDDVNVLSTINTDGDPITTADPTKAAWVVLRVDGGASGGNADLGSNDDSFDGRVTVPAGGFAQLSFICKAGEAYFIGVSGTVTVGKAYERSLG